MPKSIEFTAQGSSSLLGNFSRGDIARNIPDALADHLVNEAKCAKFLPEVVKAKAADPNPAQPTARRGKKTTVDHKGT
jgi:hypothetical protein